MAPQVCWQPRIGVGKRGLQKGGLLGLALGSWKFESGHKRRVQPFSRGLRKITLADVSDIFYVSSLGDGEREEESEAKRGGWVLFKNGEGGRVSEEGRRGGAHWGWEGVAGGRGGG